MKITQMATEEEDNRKARTEWYKASNALLESKVFKAYEASWGEFINSKEWSEYRKLKKRIQNWDGKTHFEGPSYLRWFHDCNKEYEENCD
jgi:hypothetical protein